MSAAEQLFGPPFTPGEVWFCLGLSVCGIIGFILIIRHGMKRVN